MAEQYASLAGPSVGNVSNAAMTAAMNPPAMSMAKGYCWTHGVICNNKHMSATCKNKAMGHQDTATMQNKMGGVMMMWMLCVCNTGMQE